MSTFKFSSVATFLVVFSTILSTFAKLPAEICEDLLLKETNFINDNVNGGLYNFKSAFKHLSYKKINNGYSEITDEIEKKLVKRLVLKYFDYLIENQQIVNLDLQSVKSPIEWCYYAIHESNIPVDPTVSQVSASIDKLKAILIDSSIYTCMDSVAQLLPSGFHLFYKDETFKNLYKNWDINSVQEIGNINSVQEIGKEPNQLSKVDELLSYWFGISKDAVENNTTNDPSYARKYFDDFVTFVDNLSLGNIQSIRLYCTWTGYMYVKDD